MSHVRREMRALVAKAEKAGWRVEAAGAGTHIMLFPPDPEIPLVKAYINTTEWRAPKNLRAQLRRAGLDV